MSKEQIQRLGVYAYASNIAANVAEDLVLNNVSDIIEYYERTNDGNVDLNISVADRNVVVVIRVHGPNGWETNEFNFNVDALKTERIRRSGGGEHV